MFGVVLFWFIRRLWRSRPADTQPAAIGLTQNQARETVFQQLAQSIRQVFWVADCDRRRLVYVSPAMLDVWLLEPQLLISDPSQWFASVHPVDRSRAESAHQAMLAGDTKTCEYRVVRPDGEICFVRNRAFPVLNSTGKVHLLAGILEDVTSERSAHFAFQRSRDELVQHVNELKSENRERRRAEEQLRTAKDLAEAGSLVKSQFLCNISHELRTPLNGIIGMVQIALDSKLTGDQRDCLKSAAESAANLLAIVNDILDFSETDAGRLAISEAPFNLRDAVREVAKRMAVQANGKKLEFSWFVSAGVPLSVVGDKRRLAQVLTQLCTNAVKFTGEGSIALEVSCVEDADTTRRAVRFMVSDTGIGVPVESRKAIFEAFTQADGSLTRSYGGTGIGLAICARLVALMSGEISLESEQGRGSRFSFTVPLGLARVEHPTLNRTAGAPLSVLIVDSSPASCADTRHQTEEQLADTLGGALSSAPVLSGFLQTKGADTRRQTEEQLADTLGGAVDSAPVLSGFLEKALAEEHLDVTFYSERSQVLSALDSNPERFAAIFLAGDFATEVGLEFARLLCDKYHLADRLILMLGSAKNSAQFASCRELGITSCFARPFDYDEIRQRLRPLTASLPLSTGSKIAVSKIAAEVKPGTLRSLRVLLVEDNPINQTVLKRMLQKQGHSVLTADHGLAALSKLDEIDWHVDLVLMDVQMPELDGFGATARIRVLEQTRGGHLPIIAATAHAMVGDAERCLAAGMDGYISKPIQMEVLSQTIASVMAACPHVPKLERKVS